MQVHRASRGTGDGLWSLLAQQDGSDAAYGGFDALVLADIMTVRDSAAPVSGHSNASASSICAARPMHRMLEAKDACC